MFLNGTPVEVQARTRFNVDDEGNLLLWLDLLDAQDALDLAWDQVCETVESGAGLDGRLFQGKA